MSSQTLSLMRKEIDHAGSKVLYVRPLTLEHFRDDWTTHGKNPKNAPGMAILKQAFPGNAL